MVHVSSFTPSWHLDHLIFIVQILLTDQLKKTIYGYYEPKKSERNT